METKFKGHFKLSQRRKNAKHNDAPNCLPISVCVFDLFEVFVMVTTIATNIDNISAPKYIALYPESF